MNIKVFQQGHFKTAVCCWP